MTDRSPTSAEPALPFLAALGAYLTWGVVGYYFRIITVGYGITPFILLANRVVWSLVFLTIVLACRRGLSELLKALKTPRLVAPLAVSSLLIAINWIIFIYAAATGRLVQASLGYFLTPLMSVLLGVVLLREKLRLGQIIATALAAIGVAPIVYLKAGSAWIPVGLMLSFSLYGLMRKRIVIGPVIGLAVETSLLLPFAVLFIALTPVAWPTAIPLAAHALLIAAGVITAIPLLLFAYAARRLRLVTVGLLQYLSPSVQFLVAITLAHEAVTRLELAAFAMIWLGLAVFAIDGVIGHRNRERTATDETPAAALAASLRSQA